MQVDKSTIRHISCALGIAASLVSFAQCSKPKPPVVPDPVAALTAVSVNPSSVTGGTSAQGTATLSTGAPSGGATVTLSSSNTAAATVPANVVIPAGAGSGTFTVTTLAVGTSATASISGSYLGTTLSAALSVAAQPVVTLKADFTVTTDAGSGANAGQCAVVDSGDATLKNKILCEFDGGLSTSPTGIASYAWTFPGATPVITKTTPKLSDPFAGCGGNYGLGNLPVTLTVTATGGGTATVTKQVFFSKPGPC